MSSPAISNGATRAGEVLLAVEGISAGYGSSEVLHDIALEVRAGEIVSVMGRNGMGKTTTMQAIMGNVKVRGGAVRFCGNALERLEPYRIARMGLAIVPEGRRIFGNLTVLENLRMGEANRFGAADPWTVEKVYGLFPRLQERATNLGTQLSGGEQQMLAIGRALMTNPRLVILDEATEGLAPIVRDEIWRCLAKLKGLKQAVIVIDKNIDRLLRIADHHYVVEKGHVVWSGDSSALAADAELKDRYLSV